MSNSTKILMVEHNPDDIELILDALKTSEISFISEIVQDEEAYTAAIKNFIPDIILSDYSLPAFDGTQAFNIREVIAPGIPFLFVSGSIGEEKSIEYIRNGVTDYVLKDKLFTIGVKVKRALKEAREQNEKNKTEKELVLSESQLARAQQVAQLGSWELNFDDNELRLSLEGSRIFGFPPDQNRLSFETWSSLVHPDDIDDVLETIQQSRNSLKDTAYHHRIILKDGTVKYIYSESKFEFNDHRKPVGLYGTMQDVTERKKNEEVLRKAYEEKNTVLERIDDGFFAIDENSIVTYWNKRAEILLDIKREEVIGKNLHDVFAATASRAFYDHYQKAINEKTTVYFEEFSKRTNKWFAVSAFASDNGLSVYFKDVTERKLAADKIKESELRYRSLIEQATDAICITDAFLKFIDINLYASEVFGYTLQEALQLSLPDILFMEDLAANPLKIEELKSGKTIRNERRLKRKDGTAVNMEVSTKIMEDGRLIMFGHDITERKKAEQLISESEKKYRQIVETAQEGIWMIDENNQTTFVNKKMCEMLEYTEVEMMGRTNLFFKDEAEQKNALQQIERRKQGLKEIHESSYVTKSGRVISTQVSTNPLLDEDGVYRGALAMVTDITEKKKAEQQLIIQEKRYRALVENGADAVVIISPEGKLLYASPTVEKILGYTDEEILKLDMFSFVHPDDVEGITKVWEQVFASPGVTIPGHTGRMLHKDGSWRWMEATVTNMLHDPALNGIVDNFRDVTEKIEAEQLREFERRDKEALINTTEDLIWSVSSDFKLIAANHAFIKSIQKSAGISLKPGDELMMEEKFPAEFLSQYKELYLQALNGESFITEIYNPALGKQEESWAETRFNPIYDGEEITGIACYSRDTTAAKIFQNELVSINKKLGTAQQIAQLGYWELGMNMYTLYWSDEVYNIWGVSPETFEVSYENYYDSIHPDDQEIFDQAQKKALSGKGKMDIEHRIILPGGKIKYVQEKGELIYNDKGIAIRFEGTVQDITERKKAEATLIKRDRQLTLAAEMAKLGYWEHDIVEDIFTFTDEFYAIFKTSAEKVGGYTMTSVRYAELFVHPDDREMIAASVAEAINSKDSSFSFKKEHRILYANGETGYISVLFYIIKDNQGRTIKNFGVNQDITERRKAEEEIRNSEEKRRLIMNAALDAIICIDTTGNITFWNPQAEAIFGWKENEVMGKRLSGFIIPEKFRSRHDEGIGHYLKTGKGPALNTLLELSAIKKNGEEFPVELTVMPVRQGDEEFFCAFIRDITERKKAEEEIKKSNERYHYVTKATFDAIWDWDIVTNDVFWGDAYTQLFGEMDEADMSAIEKVNKRIHPEETEQLFASVTKALKGTDLNWNYEHRYLKSDASYAYVSNQAIIVRDKDGNALRVIGAMQDISKQKQEVQRLKLLESVITNSHDSVIITEAEPFDEPGPRIVYVNEAFTKMTGYTSAEVIGKTPRILQGPKSDKYELERLSQALRKWEPCEITIINYKKNGDEFWINLSVNPVADEKGWFTHWISVERDVTESKLIEIRLIELHKNLQKHAKELAISNAELEQFAYVASHDLQEPLRMVTSFLTQIEKKYSDVIDDKGKQYIAFAVDGAKRMRQIILDLLEFSRVGRMEDKSETVNLNEVVEEVQILFRKKIKEKSATILIDLLPVIKSYRSPMRQVFQNLISNALKYARDDVPSQIQITVKKLKTYWQFGVRDNGIGIDKEYFDKIFIIFQRLHNKDEYSGTGMGLAVTKKIMENLGGKIWVESEEGKGSTFYFTIPEAGAVTDHD